MGLKLFPSWGSTVMSDLAKTWHIIYDAITLRASIGNTSAGVAVKSDDLIILSVCSAPSSQS